MSMCDHCLKAQSLKWWGGYLMTCVHCCARLVRSARPLRHCQESMLALAARHGNSKAAVLDALRALA
jgi:hypothetical protein